MKDEIIKEEIMHKKEMWFNTGLKNVYMLQKPLIHTLREHEFRNFSRD